jgi:cytochrome P450
MPTTSYWLPNNHQASLFSSPAIEGPKSMTDSAQPSNLYPSVCGFYEYQSKHGSASANRLLFAWLSNDDDRAKLYADMVANECALYFSSNASSRNNDVVPTDYDWADGARTYDQPAVLLVHPQHIEQALTQSNSLPQNANKQGIDNTLEFSNSPFQGLGGFFMLGLDAPLQHDLQRAFALLMLEKISPRQYDALATLALKAGSLTALKSHDFDLVNLAENIAIRYATMAFGFAQKDLGLIEAVTRKVGRGLQYQMMARNFVFEPNTMPESRAGLAALAQRATEIMQLYVPNAKLTRTEQEEKDEIETERARLGRFKFRVDANGTESRVLQMENDQGEKGEVFIPILPRMAVTCARSGQDQNKNDTYFGLVEKGLIAAGLVGGAVTNIQNAICICIAQFFKSSLNNPAALLAFQDHAYGLRSQNPDAQWIEDDPLLDRIKEALRVNPPAAFIPRRVNKDGVKLKPSSRLKCERLSEPKTLAKGTLVLIGMGGASHLVHKAVTPHNAKEVLIANQFRNALTPNKQLSGIQNEEKSEKSSACPFARIFGGAPLARMPDPKNLNQPRRWEFTHSCPGMMMSMHVINYTVRQLMLLPGLSQKINPNTGEPYGLEKRWGFQSSYYPMLYLRERLLAQTPLQTLLPIKTPVDVHSVALRQILRLGAPFIEKVLQDAGMVHFASFAFVDNDSKLMLFTMYDGDFDAYIAHFAREFGHLFDRFFSHIAVQPIMPIREHPFEFVQYLKQFLVPPVEGYYFSAYPETAAVDITNHFTRQYDFNTIRGKQ